MNRNTNMPDYSEHDFDGPPSPSVQTIMVTGRPVSGMDGSPTVVLVQGKRVDLPPKCLDPDRSAPKCTDVFWAVLYIIATLAWVALGVPLFFLSSTGKNHSDRVLELFAKEFFGFGGLYVGIGAAFVFSFMLVWVVVKLLKNCSEVIVKGIVYFGWAVFLLLGLASGVVAFSIATDESGTHGPMTAHRLGKVGG